MPAASTPAGRPDHAPEDVHVITTAAEKWRFRCPRFRHSDWRLWNGVFSCRTCKRLRNGGREDVDPVFAELYDEKEKQLVPRERIRVER